MCRCRLVFIVSVRTMHLPNVRFGIKRIRKKVAVYLYTQLITENTCYNKYNMKHILECSFTTYYNLHSSLKCELNKNKVINDNLLEHNNMI